MNSQEKERRQGSLRPEFSIVIPVYNAEKYLERCINSILAQSYSDFEAIFVDDGSTDRSADIIRTFRDPRIRLIRQSNKGEGAARNTGINQSTHEYIAFIDADDEWRPHHLETLAFLIGRYDRGGIYCTGFRMEYEKDSFPVEIYSETGPDSFAVFTDPFRVWSIELVNNSSNSAVRKEVLDTVGLYKEGEETGADLDLWIRIGVRYPLVVSSTVTSIFHQTGFSNKPRFRKAPEYILACRTAGQFLRGGQDGLTLNPNSVREYIKSRVRISFWAYTALNARESLIAMLMNSDVASWTPGYLRLSRAPGIWPLLRVAAWIYRLLQSRMTLRLFGGEKRRRGVVRRLVKDVNRSWVSYLLHMAAGRDTPPRAGQ